MASIGTYVTANAAPIRVLPPTTGSNAWTVGNSRFHLRAAVTNTAGTLDSFITGGYPTLTPPNQSAPIYPSAVNLGIESASTGKVYITFDGGSSAEVSATLGFEIPTLPNFLRIAGNELFTPGTSRTIRVVSSTGTQNVQCFLEF